MNASRFAVGLVVLALAGLWYCAGGTNPLPMSRAAEGTCVTPPLSHENLTVYFVYGKDTVPDAKVMTLNEALERELAIVHETSDVNTLAVENKSPDCELFIQSGDIVKGGKQDRMAATDMLLPPKSGVVAMKAHCVEKGRWTGRGNEDSRKFASSEKFAAGKDLKYANAIGQQSAVWQNVSMNQTKLNDNLKTTVNAVASPTSFQLTLEAPAVKASVAEYEAALKAAGADRDDIIGVVFVVNGQVTGAEVYGSNALFRKAWPKLLNAAAVEAVAERTDKRPPPAPSAREIEYFLACAAEPEPAEATVGGSPNLSAQQLAARLAGTRPRNSLYTALPVNANEEVFQTEGRAPGEFPGEFFQTEGRPPAGGAFRGVQTGNFQSWTIGHRIDIPLGRPAPPAPNPGPNPPAGVSVGYSASNAPSQPDRVGRVIIEGNERLHSLNRGNGQAAPPPAAPIPAGNRLNSNRNENRSTLMVESRDPARQNAVIHRSYIKK